jgi:hypothetical protein
MVLRPTPQDAARDIRAVKPASGNNYTAVVNSDGSISVTQHNPSGTVVSVLPFKFYWNLTGNQGSAKTDANAGSNDTMCICDADGSNPRFSDFQQWLNGLT